MKAILIFDSLNDLLYSKWDEEFLLRMKSFNDHEGKDNLTDADHVCQLLSPVITSQRIMSAQFSNTYTGIQCAGVGLVFEEWSEHLVVVVSPEPHDEARREALDCRTLVQHICGDNLSLLRSSVYQEWLSELLEANARVEGVPGAVRAAGAGAAPALAALRSLAKELKPPLPHYHLVLFHRDQLLALYSSRGSEDLAPADVLLVRAHCLAALEYWGALRQLGGEPNARLPWLSAQCSAVVQLCAAGGPCLPHSLHLLDAGDGRALALLLDLGLRECGLASRAAHDLLAAARRMLLQRALDALPAALDSLDLALRRLADALRKTKAAGSVGARLLAKFAELRRACAAATAAAEGDEASTTALAAEAAAAGLRAALEPAGALLRPDVPALEPTRVLAALRAALPGGAPRASPRLRQYVEEFPGLVYLAVVDRGAGRYVSAEVAGAAGVVPRGALREVLRRAAWGAREGYGAATWRRGALHACAVRWWERRGRAVRARAAGAGAVRALPPPGELLGGFYAALREVALGAEGAEATLKEVVAVHLGLVPASSALQHARRLAHDLAPPDPALPADLL